MANTNIINAVFGSGICAVTTSAFRANYGMVLRFSGIDLPTAFEVDFSNYDVMGRDSITMIGQNGEVQIPDDLWDSGLNIYAYVYLHPTDDSGVTVYTVTIPVLGRPNRTEEEPTPHEQTLIEQAISALNDAVEATAADVETTTANAQAAAQSEANAATSERSAAASAGAALASQNAAHASETASAQSAQSASGSADQASQSAQASAESADTAQGAAASAERSEQNASASAASAQSKANEAASSAATASGKATESAQSASSAASAAQNAASAATAAAQSASSASTAAQNATSSAQSAESSATDAEQAKTDAQDAKDAAEQAMDNAVSAADRAEQAEQEVLSSMDGTYEDLTSGNAQQLLSTVTDANSVPYLFRPTAANADRAYLDEVVGGTVAWNQIVKNGNFADTSNWSASAATISASGNVLTVTKSENTGDGIGYAKQSGLSFTVGHKYIMSVSYKGIAGKKLTLFSNNSMAGMTQIIPADSDWHTVTRIVNVTETPSVSGILWLNYTTTTADNVAQFKDYNIIDLTQMFGSTIADYIYSLEQSTAGAGIAYFRKLFPKDYYAYNAGELLSVNTSQHKMVGLNQWDEEWELGYIVDSTGVNHSGSSWIRSKNYIPVIPNTVYYFANTGRTANADVYFYDASKAYLGRYTGGHQTLINANQTFSTPPDAHYMRFYMADTYGSTYHNDICINLSDPVRNGEYEPYVKRTYPLDSSLTLRGIPKLDASGNLYYDGDTYAADGTVTRKYGIVDLGTLYWTKNTISDNTVFYNNAITNIAGSSNASGYAICSKYLQRIGSAQSATDKQFVLKSSYAGYNSILIVDNSYTNASAFKAAMSGVYLVYELATPTTETAEPYRHLQICDPNGTEEFVSTGIVPVGHNTRYPENLRAKIEGLPWNFNSIIAMTETTTTASKAYSVGDYFILNNVLYRVTSAISSGGTITIGTNCRATTIMDEIKALS